MTDYLERISIDPEICHGRTCIRGTRIMVSVVLENLAAGLNAKEITESYPSLKEEGIQAALLFGAELAKGKALDIKQYTDEEARALAAYMQEGVDAWKQGKPGEPLDLDVIKNEVLVELESGDK